MREKDNVINLYKLVNMQTEIETAINDKIDLNTRIDGIQNDLSSNINNISTINSSLSDKANQIDLNAVSNKVGDLSTLTTIDKTNLVNAIKENTLQLSQKANKTVVDTISATVSGHTTTIATNTTNIALKSDKTYVDTIVASVASGSPKAVSLVANMIDTTKNYVYTGLESGYTSGNWYYYNGSAWTSGGVYQSTGIAEKTITKKTLSDAVKNVAYSVSKKTYENINSIASVDSVEESYLGISSLYTTKEIVSGTKSPTNPSTISGYVSLTTVASGKNLFPIVNFNYDANGITMSIDTNGVITINGTSTAQLGKDVSFVTPMLLKAGTYALGKVDSLANTGINFLIYDNSNNIVAYVSDTSVNQQQKVFTLTKDTLISKYRVFIATGKIFSNIKIYPQLEMGNVFTTFEKSTSTVNSIVPTTPLYGLINAKDVINFTSGVITHKTAKLILDGSETWNIIGSGNTAYFSCALGITCGTAKQISSHFDYTDIYSTNTTQGFSINTSGGIRLRYTTCATVDDLKTWLASNNVTIIYELSTYTTENFTAIAPISLDGKNIIYSDGEYTKVKYYKYKDAESIRTIRQVMSKLVLSDSTKNIKLLGDSITHGVGGTSFAQDGTLILTDSNGSYYRNPNGYCWANQFKLYLEQKFNCLVTNNAVAGKDSSFIVTNLSTLISSTDDIVICNIGTNNRTYPHTKIDYYADLQKIYDYCTNLGIDIIFVANIPAQVNAENYSAINLHMEDINHLIMKFTTNNNIEYVDLYSNFIDYVETRGLDLESLYSDTLHPNDSGYDIIFYCICKGLGIARRIPNATWTN